MLIRKNPTIMTNDQLVESDEQYDTNSDDFMMAFAMENYKTKVPMDDPRYTRWVVKFWKQFESGQEIEYDVLEPCSEEQFARFHPTQGTINAQKVVRLQAEGHLYCYDWKKVGSKLKGTWRDG